MANFTNNTVLKAREHVLWREIDGEIVLLDTKKGLYYGIEGTGVVIWKQLQETVTFQHIIDAVMNEVDAKKETLTNDIRRFSEKLMKAGLIECMPEHGAA